MKIHKGFKVQIFPTKEQTELIWKHIDACRYIWNYMLELQQQQYKAGEKHMSTFDMHYALTMLKKDGKHDWLYEVSNKSLQRACKDLEDAYQRFFKKISSFPKFKSRKKSKPRYPVCTDIFYFADNKFVQIQKLGRVKYKTDYDLPIGHNAGKFSDVRISYVGNKWFVSFTMECENQAPELTDVAMGIDLGIKELAVVAMGDKQFVFSNINKSKKMKKLVQKQKHIQRSISRKYECNRNGKKYNKTNNIIKWEDKLRKIYGRIKNIRANYIHQITHGLISMLPCKVVMEDLNLHGMRRNRHISRAVQEQCFYEFRRQMEYKCKWHEIDFVLAGMFYPSSKTCSYCGNIKKDLKLSDRVYRCPKCGLIIDRDYNAALNLSRYAA